MINSFKIPTVQRQDEIEGYIDYLTNKDWILLFDWAIETYCDVFQQRTTTNKPTESLNSTDPNTPLCKTVLCFSK